MLQQNPTDFSNSQTFNFATQIMLIVFNFSILNFKKFSVYVWLNRGENLI